MKISAIRRAYRSVLAIAFVLSFAVGLSAQVKLTAVSTSPSSIPRGLNSTLTELLRTAPATNHDLANLQQGGKLHWVTFWRGEKTQKTQMAAALQRNLQFAVPDLVHDAQASGGNISTTFKLYKDLSVVCESLDSLLPPSSHERKGELTALSNDLADMNRLKEELSSYIQQTAASLESKNPQLASSAGHPKRVIVDDNIPEKPSPRKSRSPNQ